MASQKQLDYCYMQMAHTMASLSKSERKKVGAIIVTSNGVLIPGVNGMAPGGSNYLEYIGKDGSLVSKEEVIHAELNAILKAAKEGVSIIGGTLYLTLSPCFRCSEMVVAAGIRRVVYCEQYRDTLGVYNLEERGIIVDRLI